MTVTEAADYRTHTPSVVPEVLREYGRRTSAALADYLPKTERPYLDELLLDYPARGGKMMRPSLCIAIARAFGGEVDAALNCAVSIELLHNALLIHDDIEDESLERRGRPTLHELHGVPLALNAGDALTLLSLRPLLDNTRHLAPELVLRMVRETERMAWETAEGQALDIGWRRDNVTDLDESAYLEMVLKKTCWFGTIYPCRLGALIGTRGAIDDSALDSFTRFGFFLGAAFQIQDDLLNLLDGTERYGKERDGDLWEGKRTLMLVDLLERCDADERQRVCRALDGPRELRDAGEVAFVRERMDHYGCLDTARQIAFGLAGAAQHECSVALSSLPDSRDKRFVEGLATWIFERT